VSQVEWNKTAGRVEAVSALMFDQIAIEQSRALPDPEAAAELLARKGVEKGLAKSEDVDAFTARARFAGIEEAPVEPALRSLATGLRSLFDLEAAARDGGLVRAVERQLSSDERRRLDELAPEWIRLPGGRRVRVHYEADQAPWIESRLQDFWGMTTTPTVGRGVPVVVRLLAPNQRPVQLTTDLAGFWTRLYPEIRKQLSRRYPKHKWP
jgi:ATP-dependent helicase HrpB